MLEGLTPPSSIKGSCKVATVCETLSDADKTILLQAIEDRNSWPIKTLARALSERGLNISDTPLTNHRSKSCVCFR